MELHLKDVENFRAFSRYAHEKRGAVGKSMMEDFRNLPEKEQKVMLDYISRRDGGNPGKIAYTTPHHIAYSVQNLNCAIVHTIAESKFEEILKRGGMESTAKRKLHFQARWIKATHNQMQ